ncbi:esterase/lipase [Mycolicibacterium rhodesiae NBB3]|jgi:acetyl esterase/lipase|uniref:Esterase/lipase n=1 Tax=Mycolicibacterium rhodesiae (strain NBB3) TaxID=710685 RepID=G8RLW3_MYCRN|nr:alpha/beta hydrolase [Mycolicibacterium rhodesiae]AEV76125.1 esterase/lipase [Mycolicibacterium rhodesiae NBB3]
MTRSVPVIGRSASSRASGAGFSALLGFAVSNPSLLVRLRPSLDAAIARMSPVVPGTEVVPARLPLGGEWVRGPGVPVPVRGEGPVILVLHGSGYVACSARTHRGFASHLSAHSGILALTVNYRLAPESPFPAAEDDSFAAYRWLLDRGYDPAKVVIAGDSAGGHLAVAVALRAKREGVPGPAALSLFGPLIDPAFRASSADPRSRKQPLHPKLAARALAIYVGGHDVDDPRLCLLNADLSELPPIDLHYGSRELMRADAEAFAAKVIAAGGRCDTRMWPGLMHGYWLRPLDERRGLTSLMTAGQFLGATVA